MSDAPTPQEAAESGLSSHALFGSLNGVTDDDICRICKHPVAGIGSPVCSAPHLASRYKCRIDKLEASLREMIDLNETTGDPDPEITNRARALLLPNADVLAPAGEKTPTKQENE